MHYASNVLTFIMPILKSNLDMKHLYINLFLCINLYISIVYLSIFLLYMYTYIYLSICRMSTMCGGLKCDYPSLSPAIFSSLLESIQKSIRQKVHTYRMLPEKMVCFFSSENDQQSALR